MSSLPHQWRMITLGSCLLRRREAIDPGSFPNETFNFVGLEDIAAGGLGTITPSTTLGAEIRSLKTQFRRGDILYGKLRPYLNKVAIAPVDGVCSTDIWAFSVPPWMDPYFVTLLLSSTPMVSRLSQLSQGANLPRVNASAFDRIRIPVPTLSEQKRIATIFEEANSVSRLYSEFEAQLQRLIPAIFDDLFKAFLNGSVPCEHLKLGELLSEIKTGWSPNAEEFPASDGNWGILKLSAVTFGRYNPLENKSLPHSEEPRPDLEVKSGDVLISRKNTRELVGATVFVWETPPKLMIPDLIFRLALKAAAPVGPHYLWALLSHPEFRPRVRQLAAGAAGSMPNIPKNRLEKLRIPIPPLALQLEFKQRLEIARNVELEMKNLAIAPLRQSIADMASSGTLTMEWRSLREKAISDEANDRDHALSVSGISVVDALKTRDHMVAEIDRRRRELSQEQGQLFTSIQSSWKPDAPETWVFTHETLAESLDSALRGNADAIRRHLEVFAARGLIIPISREVELSDGTTEWRVAYRRPHVKADDGPPEDAIRKKELANLAKQIKELQK